MLRRRLSYANVISSLALFVALGGTGYAVTQLPRNSVGSRQLKANAVTSAKIRPRAVQRSDLAPNARGGARGPRGPAGPGGAQGATGPSETIQAKHFASTPIPSGAGGSATLAAITVSPGSWMFNAQSKIVHQGTGASEFFDCDLRTASGDTLQRGTARVGEDALATLIATIPVQVAATFAVPTQVLFVCSHPSTIPGDPRAEQSALLATRLGSLEDR